MPQYKKITYAGGFTFIESLVAISVLLLAVAGPLTLASNGLRAARIAREQINANYLAQEAIEYVRYRRDSNVLAGRDWLYGLDLCRTNHCTIDVWTGDISECLDDQSCPIKFDEATGVYGYESGADSIFTRKILISDITQDQDVSVDVSVTWKDGIITRTYNVAENLMRWQ